MADKVKVKAKNRKTLRFSLYMYVSNNYLSSVLKISYLPLSAATIKYPFISGCCSQQAMAESAPQTIKAVAKASARIQFSAITVAESKECCTGYPVRGSMVWAYFTPSLQ